ncbi:smad nuclear-interacting protein 1-like [Maniola hyperantus]|uniref:smad nuclear-interacting protein 1-like n=1 Tax=Aphantopus hyperantus TaxID=2795564 RepID=UPI00156A55C8|nr:smad nuclear-interacting protein 1 [Maniola hyperantus]
MKSKKRHHDSSEESEESDASVKSSSTSESDSDDSSVSELRHKKKKKRADSSDSDSNSDQKRAKKRKHKKKKKKHSKKKRRSDSLDDISDDAISISDDGEISSKKRRKHKHKHSKRAHSSVSEDERYENHGERRLHSVVKERRASSEAGSQPSRTYYQKEYHEPASTDNYTREQELQKFYRGTSKEKRDYRDNYNYERERSDRYATQDDKYRQRDKYGQGSHFTSNQEYGGRQREYNDYKRPVRYEEPRREDHYKRAREPQYEPREEHRGNNKYNRYEEKPIKRQEYDDRRDYRDRRAPAEPDRPLVKEYEKRDKYHDERPSLERSRDVRRDRPSRPEKPPVTTQYKERSRSRSEDRSYKEKRRDDREDKSRDRYKDEGGERVRDRYKEERDERRERERRDKPEPPKPRERKSRFDNGNDKEYSWGKNDDKKEGDKSQEEKEKPNFGLSGKLTADANTVNGVVIKYTEPDDAKQPKRRWRFYPFKGDKALPILYIHRQSSFLIGRDKKVVDIALEHPSISKQHAALQYRATPFTRADGSQGRRVRPYIIDLESANGTFVNNKKVSPRRYTELLERDVVKFGFSAREYVLLHENSKDDAQDDDQEPAVATTDRIKHEKRAKEAAAADGD